MNRLSSTILRLSNAIRLSNNPHHYYLMSGIYIFYRHKIGIKIRNNKKSTQTIISSLSEDYLNKYNQDLKK